MAAINLLYATKVNLGGWATFTVHLYHLLRAAGHDVQLLKFGNNTETFTRPFGNHGVHYRNIAPDQMGNEFVGCLNIVAALGKHYVAAVGPLLNMSNTGIVVHDTAESTNRMDIRRPWVIRKALAPLFSDSVFIRHPYMPHYDISEAGPPLPMAKRRGLVATSRVDFDKNTTMILDANRLGANVDIVGFENRLYTKFKVMPNYPEWVQSPGTHPRSGEASFQRLVSARAMVDLTDIKGDGGGTQYTFLEAWDAGAVPVIGAWWYRVKDDMVPAQNCLIVEDAVGLAALAKKVRGKTILPQLEELAAKGRARLKKYHGPKAIAPQVVEWLEEL